MSLFFIMYSSVAIRILSIISGCISLFCLTRAIGMAFLTNQPDMRKFWLYTLMPGILFFANLFLFAFVYGKVFPKQRRVWQVLAYFGLQLLC